MSLLLFIIYFIFLYKTIFLYKLLKIFKCMFISSIINTVKKSPKLYYLKSIIWAFEAIKISYYIILDFIKNLNKMIKNIFQISKI